MVYAGRFHFLKIFHHHDFEKCFSKAVEAFKVWASRAIPAGRKFSKRVLRSKKCLRHVNKVSKPIQMTLRPFSKFSTFSSFFFFFLLFFFFFLFSFFFFFFFFFLLFLFLFLLFFFFFFSFFLFLLSLFSFFSQLFYSSE